jgi:hypothetical protein
MKRNENGNKCKPQKEHQKEGNDNMMNQNKNMKRRAMVEGEPREKNEDKGDGSIVNQDKNTKIIMTIGETRKRVLVVGANQEKNTKKKAMAIATNKE